MFQALLAANRKKCYQLSQFPEYRRGLKLDFASRNKEVSPRDPVLPEQAQAFTSPAWLARWFLTGFRNYIKGLLLNQITWTLFCFMKSPRQALKRWIFSSLYQKQSKPQVQMPPKHREGDFLLKEALRPKCWRASRALHSTHRAVLQEHGITGFGWCPRDSFSSRLRQTLHSKSSNHESSEHLNQITGME